MKKAFILSASLCLALALSNAALAQCCAKSKGADDGATAKKTGDVAACHGESAGKAASADKAGCSGKAACGDKAGCAGKNAVAAGMPKMLYKVGDQTVCCSKQADELAGGDAAKIRFIVAEKEYTDRPEALKAYAGVLDAYLNNLQNIRFVVGEQCVSCPMTAAALAKSSNETVKYRVAGVTFTDQAKAEAAAKQARAAAEKVKLTCVVDGKNYDSQQDAEKACAGNGKHAEYVVGETKTNCLVTAGVELAKARIAAAQKALEESVGT